MTRTEFEKPVTWKALNLIALIPPPHWPAPRGLVDGTLALGRHLTIARNARLELDC